MLNSLSLWSDISQIIAVVVAALALMLQVAAWIWPTAKDFRHAVNPYVLRVARGLLLISIGYLAGTLVTRIVVTNEKLASIKSMPLSVSAYGAKYDPQVGQGEATLAAINDDEYGTNYRLTYVLPDSGEGYAGLSFRFNEPKDLTTYGALEVTIIFEDGQARCDLVVTDTAGKATYVRLGEATPSSNDITASTNGSRQIIRIPIATNLKGINAQSVKEISFNAGTYFTRGRHSFVVSDVRFMKQ